VKNPCVSVHLISEHDIKLAKQMCYAGYARRVGDNYEFYCPYPSTESISSRFKWATEMATEMEKAGYPARVVEAAGRM